jgi:hypothetical protein
MPLSFEQALLASWGLLDRAAAKAFSFSFTVE